MTRKELCDLCNRARDAVVMCAAIVKHDVTPTQTDRDAVLFWWHVYDVAHREMGGNSTMVDVPASVPAAFEVLVNHVEANGHGWSSTKTKYVKQALVDLRTALKAGDA